MGTVAWRPSARRERLEKRAALIASIRAFFEARGVLEVTTPVLSRYAISTPAIESFETTDPARYLRTSPELALKRLLAAGFGDVFEIGPVFRRGEQGARHNPEFTLLEWYRVGVDEHALMDEVADLLSTVLPLTAAPTRVRYADAVKSCTGVDVFDSPLDNLARALAGHTELPAAPLSRDDLLDLLFATAVAPTFPDDRLTFVHDYPASQAVLAELNPGTPSTARRFELYLGPVELGNGFFELRDADEQRARFAEDNRQRCARGDPARPADEAFLAALDHGLPVCAGVAVGVDRVVALALGVHELTEVIAFPFDLA